jgi:RNA polymerase sigma factor (sigma-70 family)
LKQLNNIEELTDEALIKGVALGNGKMLGQLYSRYGSIIRATIKQWYPGFAWEDIEDLVQEIFIAVGASSKKYKEQNSFKSWLFTIAYRKSADMRRSAQRQQKKIQLLTQNEEYLSKRGKEALLDDQSEMRKILRQVLSHLPTELREVIFLRFIQGFSAAEIGQITRVNEITVRTRLHRARMIINNSVDSEHWRKLCKGDAI